MPKVSEEHRQARRDEIISAALRAFTRKGYRGTSMADIIAEAGLSAGAIYGYFGGKQELLHAVATSVLDERLGGLLVSAQGRTLSPSETFRTLLSSISAAPFAPVLIQLWGEATTDPEVAAVVGEVFARLRRTFADVLAEWARAHPELGHADDPDWAHRVAGVLSGLGPGAILQSTVLPDFDLQEFLAGVPDLLSLERPR